MKVEIWSDIACPFCYIGKRKFENALKGFDQKDKVEITWRSFQLDPEMIVVPNQSVHEYLGKRKGTTTAEGKKMNDSMAAIASEVGLEFNFDKAQINNTMNAHRVLHLAKKHGVQNEMKQALFAAYYTDGKNTGDTETLVSIGETLGLDVAEIRKVLESDMYRNEVIADQEQAQQIGVQGVPFYVFNNKYAVSGAQPTAVFADVLNKVWEEEKPAVEMLSAGATCKSDGTCN